MTGQHHLGFYVLVSSALLCACGSSDSTGGGGGTGVSGGVTGAGGSSGSGGVSASGGIGGVNASGGTSGLGGSSGSGAAGATGIPSDLGMPCKADACSPGLTPVSYCGFAGCSTGSFCSCEIRCDKDPKVCPAGTTCSTVSDGPGTVCVKN